MATPMASSDLERFGALVKFEPEAACEPGLKGFPDDQPTVDDATHRAFDVAENDGTGGWQEGSPPKTLDRCTSVHREGCFDGGVDRRNREPKRFGAEANGGIGWHARQPDRMGTPSHPRFGVGDDVAPAGHSHRRSCTPMHLWRCGRRQNRSEVGGLAERANLAQGVSAPRNGGPQSTSPNGDVANRGVSAPRGARRWEVDAARRSPKPSSTRKPALKCLAPTKRRSLRVSRSAIRSPRCHDAAVRSDPDALDPRSWCEGKARTNAFRRRGESDPGVPSRTAPTALEALRRGKRGERCEAADLAVLSPEEARFSMLWQRGWAEPRACTRVRSTRGFAPGRVTCRARTADPRIREPRRFGAAGIG